MPKERDKRRARVRYAALLQRLGGACADCGSKEDLSVEHVEPRGYVARDREWTWRVATYIREEEEGVPLQVLCRSCNSKRGKPSPTSWWDRNAGEYYGGNGHEEN